MQGRVVRRNEDKGICIIRNIDTKRLYLYHISLRQNKSVRPGRSVEFQGKYNADMDESYAIKVRLIK